MGLFETIFGGANPTSVVREGGKAAEGVITTVGGEGRGVITTVADAFDGVRDDVVELARVPFEGLRGILAELGIVADTGVDVADIAAQAAVTVTLLLLVGLLLYLIL